MPILGPMTRKPKWRTVKTGKEEEKSMKKPMRVVLGEGKLGIANTDGETKAGTTIPTAFGIWLERTVEWKHLVGVRLTGRMVRLVAEVLE